MSIVGAFDVHRRQLTFEYLDTSSGELKRGRVPPSTAPTIRSLADLGPQTLGLMHGPSYAGDCVRALHDLASA